jgi:hypothetical protein
VQAEELSSQLYDDERDCCRDEEQDDDGFPRETLSRADKKQEEHPDELNYGSDCELIAFVLVYRGKFTSLLLKDRS